jgi:hypothetical protein
MGRRRGEISRNGIIYTWSVFGDVITVTAPDGRQKKTHVGRDAPWERSENSGSRLGRRTTKNKREFDKAIRGIMQTILIIWLGLNGAFVLFLVTAVYRSEKSHRGAGDQ